VSDRELRELARRFHESNDPADEARWLNAQLQAGELSRSQLVIAAFFGHSPAREALGLGKTELAVTGLDLRPLELQMSAEDYEEVWFRAAASSLHEALARKPGSDSTPSQGLAALEGWILCPCGDCSRPLQGWATRCQSWEDPDMRRHASVREVFASGVAKLCLAVLSERKRRGFLAEALEAATYQWLSWSPRSGRLERDGDPLHLRLAWRRELPPWALGRSDLLRERFEARG
jgi:hypothetical protein